MTTYTSFDTTILSGLPIHVEAAIYPPEPDVGIFHRQVEPTLYWPNGKHPLPNKVLDRLTEDDWRRLEEQALEDPR